MRAITAAALPQPSPSHTPTLALALALALALPLTPNQAERVLSEAQALNEVQLSP